MRPATRVRKRSVNLGVLQQSILSSLCSGQSEGSLSAAPQTRNSAPKQERDSKDDRDEKLRTRSLQRWDSSSSLASAAFAALLGAGRTNEEPWNTPAVTSTPQLGSSSARDRDAGHGGAVDLRLAV